MYEVHVESEEFREKRMVQQHQMVNQVRAASCRPQQPVQGALAADPRAAEHRHAHSSGWHLHAPVAPRLHGLGMQHLARMLCLCLVLHPACVCMLQHCMQSACMYSTCS